MEEVCIKLEPCDDICIKESTAEGIDEVCVKPEPWQDISVKYEPYDSVRVKEEHPSYYENVKNEPTCLKRHGENATDTSELYAHHIVKDELVLGPEIMERPMQDSQDEIAMKIKKETAYEDSFSSNKNMDSGEKLYKCAKCSYTSADIHNLRTHTMLHTGKKPYKCDQCSYASAGRNTLLDHMMTHAGEKRHK
ncbi:zinc finger protein 62-like isoform X3 [Cydia pomonella]|uniref:zinc finger protein 62-like isoform X3 n=1 Tax=Cydia pomonella TaxID=82600 RepID=UPI002ADE029A|nr:zinc finger protein 62-like isoform X3 [Cydia pomonella]